MTADVAKRSRTNASYPIAKAVLPPAALVWRLAEAKAVLITSHTNPDGDAIGSELALARLLSAAGKRCAIWNKDPTPSALRCLDPAGSIHSGDLPPADVSGFGLLVALECPVPARCGIEQIISQLPTLNVDHHLGNSNYGVENWVEPGFAAVGLMVLRLADSLQIELDPESANLILAAVMSDTGGFRFGNTSPSCLQDAARLLDAGASPEKVSRWLYEARPLRSIRLVALMLSSLQLAPDGRAAVASLSFEDFKEAGATSEDTEGLIEFLRTIDGVEAVALVRQVADRQFKASLRSRGQIDVERIARALSGGGHRNAAGCTFDGSLEQARHHLLSQLSAAVVSTEGARGIPDV